MKNLIGIIILLILGLFTWFLLSDSNPFMGDGPIMKDFAIEDTASVDQVFISQANGKQILLTRRGSDIWTINGKYTARPDGIQLILKTLHDVKVLSNVSKSTMQRVIARMASSATKVEFYMNGGDHPEKIWYIGDGTFSRVGTYMLLEKDGVKSSEPFITHMLMERGVLNSRFFADSIVWRDRVLLRTDPKKIKELTVKHKSDTLSSFKLTKLAEGEYQIENLESGLKSDADPELVIPFLNSFKSSYYEYIDLKSSKEHLDSIYSSTPRHYVKILMEDGKEYELKAFNMPVRKGATLGDKPIDYNPERMYVYSSYMQSELHTIVQNLTFDPLVVDMKYFTSSTTVEK